MAAWVPAPSVPVQAYGRDSPITGRIPNGGVFSPTTQQPPSPGFIGAPATGGGSDGTDVFTTG